MLFRKRRFWIACVLLVILAGCDDNPSRIVVLDCAVPLARDYTCPSVLQASAAMKIRVNPTTRTVLLDTVSDSTHNFFLGERIRDDCKVLDAKNWKCTNSSPSVMGMRPFLNEEGMSDGVYYNELIGGIGPDYYHSSISDPLAGLVVSGFVDTGTVLTFWKKCWELGISPALVEWFAIIFFAAACLGWLASMG